jgi:LysM repeat protein
VGQWKDNRYVEILNPPTPHIPDSKNIAEKKSRKAESFMSSKNSKKLSKRRYHTVNSGESLWGISRRYGLTVENIRIMNKLTDRSVIYPGQKLLVTL